MSATSDRALIKIDAAKKILEVLAEFDPMEQFTVLELVGKVFLGFRFTMNYPQPGTSASRATEPKEGKS